MKRAIRTELIGVVLLALASGLWAAAAHFDLISAQAKTYVSGYKFPATSPQLRADKIHKQLSMDTVNNVHVTALAGPASDMFSFQIDLLTNPTIQIPNGSRLTLNVINVDDDMPHNFYLTTLAPPYPAKFTAGKTGSGTLKPYDGKIYHGADLILKATQPGTLYYVCTIPGHAKGGMYGKIVITP
ncbi:MAG: sulfocyanin-like copper-binding protein [Terriglobales bacterium]